MQTSKESSQEPNIVEYTTDDDNYEIPCAQPPRINISPEIGHFSSDVSTSQSSVLCTPINPPQCMFPFGQNPLHSGKCNLTSCSACSSIDYVQEKIEKKRQSTIIYICPKCTPVLLENKNPYNLIVKMDCKKHSRKLFLQK